MEDQELRVEAIAKFARRLGALAKEIAKASDDLVDSLTAPEKAKVHERLLISPEETVRAYENLKRQCERIDPNTIERIIGEFVHSHSKEYIRAFIQNNYLPLSTKDSKDKLVRGLRQLLIESAAISAPVISVRSASSH